jgi:hypothetical protein
VYTFEARPRFAVRRFAAAPLLVPEENDGRADREPTVLFPCGALLRDGHGAISDGYQDRECRVAFLAAPEIERLLRPV